jgi:Fe-S cluster assembly ATP-binding protein
MILEIKNLSVSHSGKKLLNDISMSVEIGARHLLNGRNGSGKSTLVQTISGNPEFAVDSGQIIFDGRDVTNDNAPSRALLGIFTGGQNVPEIPGLTVMSFLKHSAAAHAHFSTGKELSMGEFLQNLEIARERLDIPSAWLNRGVNVGFSGGERKRLMLLRLLVAKPKFAMLDEPDSGADAATQKLIASVMAELDKTTFLLISHQENFTGHVAPTATTALSNGEIMIE